jgi:cobalt-zinc-cadmium efflux system membrane fusion protein
LTYDDAPILPPANGRLAYDESRTVRVASSISGRVISSPMNLGEKVKKGDVLLKLDSPDFHSALASVEKSIADLKLKQENFHRARTLYESKVLSRKDFEQAQDELISAQSEADRARKHLENLGVSLGSDSVKTGAFYLRSPLDGVITEVNVNPGMEVRPDLDKPLYVISDLRQLWLWIDVFEKDISKVQQGQPVTIKVSSWPDSEFYGRVDYISSIVNESSRSIRVRCILDNSENKLLPTMNAQVNILNLPEQKALLIPLSAVVTEGDQQFVFVKIGDDRYHWQPISLGMRFAQQAVVKHGVKAGDQVLSNGASVMRQEMLMAQRVTP